MNITSANLRGSAYFFQGRWKRIILASVFFLFTWMVQHVFAEAKIIVLQENAYNLNHFYVSRGSEVNILNEHTETLYDVIMINSNTGKKVLGIEEWGGGQSVKLGFDHEGSYLLYYSRGRHGVKATTGYLQIDVVPAYSL